MGKLKKLRKGECFAHLRVDEDGADASKALICAPGRCAAGSPH